jgi:hypothetical protein
MSVRTLLVYRHTTTTTVAVYLDWGSELHSFRSVSTSALNSLSHGFPVASVCSVPLLYRVVLQCETIRRGTLSRPPYYYGPALYHFHLPSPPIRVFPSAFLTRYSQLRSPLEPQPPRDKYSRAMTSIGLLRLKRKACVPIQSTSINSQIAATPLQSVPWEEPGRSRTEIVSCGESAYYQTLTVDMSQLLPIA